MKRLNINTLEKGYQDRVEIMLHACFQCLVDYVEKEHPFDIIDFDNDEENNKDLKFAGQEIRELYDWWKTEPYINANWKDDEIIQMNLERLVKIREFLWT